MSYVIKLKTGFYETTLCQLSILTDCISTVPFNDGLKDPIRFYGLDLISIHLTKRQAFRDRNQNKSSVSFWHLCRKPGS